MIERYRKIILSLTDNFFPLLKDKKIFVFIAPLSFYACSIWLPPFFRFIAISSRTRNFDNQAITGLIAHELCHQERYIRMGVLKYLVFAVKFLVSRSERAAEEKATDRLTIEKGFGRELLRLTEITHNDRKNKKLNELYLSPDEIKAYSESLDKR